MLINRKFSILTLLYLITFIFFLGCTKDVEGEKEDMQPKIVQPIDMELISENDRLADLFKIAVALEEYKLDHDSYPISSGTGHHWIKKNWDGVINHNGDYNPYWIEGLVPKYISELPIDSRSDAAFEKQYAYKSDGANYKLLAMNPEDCIALRAKQPLFIDNRFGRCNAYGFWTLRAQKWK